MQFVQVLVDGQPFYFDPPIELKLRQEQDVWVAVHNELDICIFAESIPALERAAEEQLRFLIQEYALESPENLTPKASSFRTRLRKQLGMI